MLKEAEHSQAGRVYSPYSSAGVMLAALCRMTHVGLVRVSLTRAESLGPFCDVLPCQKDSEQELVERLAEN